MFVTIYSHFADLDIAAGDSQYESPTWSGNLNIQASDHSLSILEDIFRFFNRVDEDDNDRLDEIGYHLPSLSRGDIVMFDGKVYHCNAVGWERVGEPKTTIAEIEDLF